MSDYELTASLLGLNKDQINKIEEEEEKDTDQTNKTE
jgi:hypothetical protein